MKYEKCCEHLFHFAKALNMFYVFKKICVSWFYKQKKPPFQFNRRKVIFIRKMCLSHVELWNFEMDTSLDGNVPSIFCFY